MEIYSDGYVSIPMNGTRVAQWEREFADIKADDFQRISRFPAVKRLTSFDNCDAGQSYSPCGVNDDEKIAP